MDAKVDIRKLQILNDRISQTLEALQQVRWSVHGLQTATTTPQGVFPQPSTTQPNPAFSYAAPIAQAVAAHGTLPTAFGLPYGNALPASAWVASFVPPFTYPYPAPSMTAAPQYHSLPTAPWNQVYGPFALENDRLSVETRATDPALLARTFPQAFTGVVSY
ncbi:MAG: hypothetical protein ACO3JL_11865 [Myxococcota bacterium]